jgi:hypothetical protein
MSSRKVIIPDNKTNVPISTTKGIFNETHNSGVVVTSLIAERGKSYIRPDGSVVCVNDDDTRTITYPDGSVSTQVT